MQEVSFAIIAVKVATSNNNLIFSLIKKMLILSHHPTTCITPMKRGQMKNT
jgi:hypothetical protein